MSQNENSKEIILEVQGLTKAFFGNVVLDHVDFQLLYGEVLGLVGENGAGKSTLVKILTGAYQPDDGKIYIDGKEVAIPDIKTANTLGISEVFQELSLANNMTVADNIFIGNIPTNVVGLIDHKSFHGKAAALIDRFGVDIKPDDLVQNLSIGKRQIVEILKAIAKEPKILILDEPTSSLEEDEIQILFSFIEELRKNNYSIIYISHHMSEIFSIVDRVMVLRDGKKVGLYKRQELDIEQLIHLMINQDYRAFFGSAESRQLSQETLLEVKELSREPFFKNINFTVMKGEILGIAGIIGSGKSELCQSLFGVGKISQGEVILHGKKVKLKGPSEVKDQGILLLPENRKTQGLFLNDQVGKNLIACVLPMVSRFGFLDTRKMKNLSKTYVNRLNIKLRTVEQIVRFLSGGNQQKVLVAKTIARGPKVFIAMDPTRGIDVGAKADIHRILHELTNSGMSIIMISSELDELINMCDRIVVMNFGQISEIYKRDEFDTEKLLLAMHQSVGQGA